MKWVEKMLILFLFCPLIEAVKVSEKVAVATLANEFMEPWQEQICIMNPDPDVWLWKYLDYPEMQFVPTYEIINDTNCWKETRGNTSQTLYRRKKLSAQQRPFEKC